MIRFCELGHPPVRILSGARCKECQRLRDARRGSRQARGYGTDHQRARAALIAMLPTACAYGCGRTLTRPDEMVAAHLVDGDSSSPRIASCRFCNRQARRG